MSHDSSLEPILRAVEPALRLVPERHLRQLLHYFIDRQQPLPTNPDLPYWFSRADLDDADILPRTAMEGSDPRLLLVTDPNDRLIEHKPRAEQLLIYWRVLFRAAVMRTIDEQLAAGTLTPLMCRDRLHQFGPAAEREIRYVLENEHFASPEARNAEVYRTFAAIYLDLDHFTSHAVEEYFPALPHGHAVRDLLSEGIALTDLLNNSRPAGAAEPEREPPPDERWNATGILATAPIDGASQTTDVRGVLQKARGAEQNGNFVRAAILLTQAATRTQGEERANAATDAITALGQLVDRLGDVMKWDHSTRQEWRQALAPLLPLAANGIWPRAARCLYELQRIPADLAREVYSVDLPEFIGTLGRRPIRRHLPHARPVMQLMALHKAHKQLLRSGLGELEQLRIDRLLHHETRHREHAIRHDFTPIIVAALTEAGFVPASRVEEIARDKLVAELLDRVCERGYLRLGDLRDAVARNQLKLPDLVGVIEFLTGDPLLRADTNLAYALDGVYRRGEFYLRWIQRFSSIFFGTPWGRLLTLYLLLPFGGAFLALMFAEEMRQIGGKVAALVSKSFAPKVRVQTAPVDPVQTDGAPPAPVNQEAAPVWDDELGDFILPESGGLAERANIVTDVFTSSGTTTTTDTTHHGSALIAWPTILGFGIFLLLMFHVPPFRRAVFRALSYLWWAVRGAIWDLPRAVWHSRPLRYIRQSSVARYLHRHFTNPLLLSALLIGCLFLVGVKPQFLLQWGWLFFVLLTLLYNTPFGWLIQDRIAESIADGWRNLRVNLLPGLLAAIIDGFRMLANWVERQLYTVDEWMRFRGGDSQGSFVVKMLLSLVWFPIAYITRFCFYLLIEPQINPIKHFPVVTVGHKTLLPLVATGNVATEPSVMGEMLVNVFGLSIPQANFWAVATITGIPGIFGFVAWELKENWRLYRANRSEKLKPVMIGSHGESMRGLLRPGFHSGTVPKLHRKTRHALDSGQKARAAQLHHELHHVSEGVQRFVERDLIPLLSGSKEWSGLTVEVVAVRFGCQRVEIEFAAMALGRDPFVIAFENVNSAIEATIPQMGWADKLTEAQRSVLAFALRGLLDMAASSRFDGRERTLDAAPEPGLRSLAQRVSWDEWVNRW